MSRLLSLVVLLASAGVSQAAFLLDGPDVLVACEPASYNWTGGAAPYNLNLGDEDRKLLVSKQTTWEQVNYPAGTVLNIRIDSGSAGSPNYAYAGTKVVQAGTSTACIPPEHNNLTRIADPIEFTTLPDRLEACNPATFSWSGGTAPYTMMFLALNSAGDFTGHTEASTSYDWTVNFPAGSTVYLNIVGTNYLTNSAPSYSRTYYVYPGTTEGCVPLANRNASISEAPPTPLLISSRTTRTSASATSTAILAGGAQSGGSTSALSGGAIAGIVVGVLALLAIYGIYTLLVRRQRRVDRERVAADAVGMKNLEGGEGGGSAASQSSLEKVVVQPAPAPRGGLAAAAAAGGRGAQSSATTTLRSGVVPDLKMKGRAV